ncbi:MAG: TetR/AcrR family transcriptional regulator [Chloroflexota bacterium]
MESEAVVPVRRRGRPTGRTAQGEATRARLYEVATRLIAERGWEATTLRDVAAEAGVSPGLLYRYYPSKRAVVLAMYQELTTEYAARAIAMPPGTWRARFAFALRTSLATLAPQRSTLISLLPALMGAGEEGIFSATTSASRDAVRAVFDEAVAGASDAPRGATAPALGWLLYLTHLAVILFWLYDRSPSQRATTAALDLLDQALRLIAPALRLPGVGGVVRRAGQVSRVALLVEWPHTEPSTRF